MQNHISDLTQFYAQKFNVPIDYVTQPWQLECLDQHQMIVGLPEDGSKHHVIGDMIVALNPDFGKCAGGDLVIVEDTPIARIGSHFLVLLFVPKNPTAMAFCRKLIDERLPKLCKSFRKSIRDQLIEKFTVCVSDRRRELVSTLREDDYELDRLSTQIMTLSRKIEGDRQLLSMFEKSPDFIKARATRTYFDLLKLVPGTYKSFHFSGDSVFGTTYIIEIEYEGYRYEFDPFVVEVNMRKGDVLITGGSPVNDYLHPHVASSDNVCWGNVGHLVSRYAGSLDLHELFLLVYQFLSTYNESDPFQKIEHWNHEWCECEDDEEPYCSWCDCYGHDVSECEDCYWCEHCQHYEEHCTEDCPNRPKDEEEEEADAELAEESA